MNAFSKPMNIKPDKIKVIHGRKGESHEFVEYQPYNSRVRYIAQKSGAWFFVYENYPGKNGSVRTLGSFHNADSAVHQAHDLALQKADGK